jgi:hypothetical protein
VAESDKRVAESGRKVAESGRKVAESGRKVAESPRARGPVGAVWGRVGTPLGRHRGDSDPSGATRGADRLGARRAHSLGREWGHGRPTRGGEGGDSVRRVARAGSHSAERVGARHYRARRHFLCGPFLQEFHTFKEIGNCKPTKGESEPKLGRKWKDRETREESDSTLHTIQKGVF